MDADPRDEEHCSLFILTDTETLANLGLNPDETIAGFYYPGSSVADTLFAGAADPGSKTHFLVGDTKTAFAMNEQSITRFHPETGYLPRVKCKPRTFSISMHVEDPVDTLFLTGTSWFRQTYEQRVVDRTNMLAHWLATAKDYAGQRRGELQSYAWPADRAQIPSSIARYNKSEESGPSEVALALRFDWDKAVPPPPPAAGATRAEVVETAYKYLYSLASVQDGWEYARGLAKATGSVLSSEL